MPILDGYEATRKLRAAGYTGPIVALTAHAMAGDDVKCRAAGCNDYTTKPIQRQHLVSMVAKYCDPRNVDGNAGRERHRRQHLNPRSGSHRRESGRLTRCRWPNARTPASTNAGH